MFTRHFAVWPDHVPHEIPFPEQSIFRNLVDTATRTPEALATIFYGGTLTYAGLLEQVGRLAGWLCERAAINPGDRVCLYLQNCPQCMIAWYAILQAGAVVVPVNPMSRSAELRHLIADTGSRLVIAGDDLLVHVAPFLGEGTLERILTVTYETHTDPGFDLKLPSSLLRRHAPADLPEAVTAWEDALAADLAPPEPETSPDDLAVIPYSSGTTGRMKGCMHTHRSVMATAVGGHRWNPAGLGRPLLVSMPLFHVTGMQNSMNGPIWHGDPMVIMARWDAGLACELIQRYRIGRWRNITTMLIDLFNYPGFGRDSLASLETIGGGGAPVPEALARRLKEITGLDYIEGYGMSETMAATHINPPARPRLQCLGIPVFGVDARVVDPDTLRELGPDQPGEILLHGPQSFQGYWNNPQATAEALLERDGKTFVRSGDIGRYDSEGYFYMVDRLKRMINVSGFKVWPNEVESILHEHPAIGEACVVPGEDARQGERVIAFVVRSASPDGEALDEAALLAWCRQHMAAYKCPRQIHMVDALPRLPSGKLDWRSLRDRVARTSDEEPSDGEPSGEATRGEAPHAPSMPTSRS